MTFEREGSGSRGVVVHFEIWFPVFTLVLGGILVLSQSRMMTRWGQTERREAQREQFQYEKQTELLELAARWHAIVDRHYWNCVADYEHSGRWPVGPNGEPTDPKDRGEYNHLWTELQVLSLLIRDQQLREEIDELRDAASHTIEATNRDQGTVAYQRETETYLAVAKRVGRLLGAGPYSSSS